MTAAVQEPVIVRNIVQLREGSLNRKLGNPVHRCYYMINVADICGCVPIILQTGFGGLGGLEGPVEEAPPADAFASGPDICAVLC